MDLCCCLPWLSRVHANGEVQHTSICLPYYLPPASLLVWPGPPLLTWPDGAISGEPITTAGWHRAQRSALPFGNLRIARAAVLDCHVSGLCDHRRSAWAAWIHCTRSTAPGAACSKSWVFVAWGNPNPRVAGLALVREIPCCCICPWCRHAGSIWVPIQFVGATAGGTGQRHLAAAQPLRLDGCVLMTLHGAQPSCSQELVEAAILMHPSCGLLLPCTNKRRRPHCLHFPGLGGPGGAAPGGPCSPGCPGKHGMTACAPAFVGSLYRGAAGLLCRAYVAPPAASGCSSLPAPQPLIRALLVIFSLSQRYWRWNAYGLIVLGIVQAVAGVTTVLLNGGNQNSNGGSPLGSVF